MRKESLIVISLVVSLLLLPQITTAFSLGVSPATANLEGSPKDIVETVFTVSTSAESDLPIVASAEGDMKKWITFTPSNLSVSKSQPLEVTAHFKIPRFAKKELYNDILTFSTALPGAEPTGTGSSIVTAVAVKVSMNVVREGDLIKITTNVEDISDNPTPVTGSAIVDSDGAKIAQNDNVPITATVLVGILAAFGILIIGKIKK